MIVGHRRMGQVRVSRMALVAGDPGFFSFFPKLFKGVGNILKGVLGLPPTAAPQQPGPVPALPSLPGGGVITLPPVGQRIEMIRNGIPGGIFTPSPAQGVMTPRGLTFPSELAVRGGRRRRRMNVLNPRALRRSMRRVQGFARFAQKTISFTRRVKMKKRRRR